MSYLPPFTYFTRVTGLIVSTGKQSKFLWKKIVDLFIYPAFNNIIFSIITHFVIYDEMKNTKILFLFPFVKFFQGFWHKKRYYWRWNACHSYRCTGFQIRYGRCFHFFYVSLVLSQEPHIFMFNMHEKYNKKNTFLPPFYRKYK